MNEIEQGSVTQMDVAQMPVVSRVVQSGGDVDLFVPPVNDGLSDAMASVAAMTEEEPITDLPTFTGELPVTFTEATPEPPADDEPLVILPNPTVVVPSRKRNKGAKL